MSADEWQGSRFLDRTIVREFQLDVASLEDFAASETGV